MKPDEIKKLFIINSLWGFIIGLMHSNWQLAIEGGQVWAAIVSYPVDNPNFMYLNNAWTILHQITGLLLKLGASEKILSMLLSGLIAMVSCLAISGLVYIFSRSIFFSTLFPLFYFVIEKKFPLGGVYPIMLWDVPHTYGSLSLSLVILIILLLTLKKNKIAGFILGVLPSIHIGWACFLYLVLFLMWIFSEKKNPQLKTILSGFFCGSIVSFISLIDFLYNHINYIENSNLEIYINAFRQWDCHRKTINFYHRSILINILALFYSIFYLKQRSNYQNKPIFIYKIMIINSILGIIAAILSYIPDHIPLVIYQLMPTRILNINAICFIACISGRLNQFTFRRYILILFLFINIHYFVFNISHIQKFYSHKDTVLEHAKKLNGTLLTSSDMMLIQARTQRPVLLYGESLDMMMYAIHSAPRISRILKDVYAISLFDPPKEVLHMGGLTRFIDKKKWEKRSFNEWLIIKKKYNISHIITFSNYQLNAKLIKKNAYYALYEI